MPRDDVKQPLLSLDPALHPVIVMGDGASPAKQGALPGTAYSSTSRASRRASATREATPSLR